MTEVIEYEMTYHTLRDDGAYGWASMNDQPMSAVIFPDMLTYYGLELGNVFVGETVHDEGQKHPRVVKIISIDDQPAEGSWPETGNEKRRSPDERGELTSAVDLLEEVSTHLEAAQDTLEKAMDQIHG